MSSQLKLDKRELLLAAATQLFVERGFHATPTSAITKAAGVSAGILFHYFKTKDDLITELYVEIKKEFTGCVLHDVDDLKSGISKLRLVWFNSWKWGINNPLKYKFLLQLDTSVYADTIKNHPEIIAKYEHFNQFLEEYKQTRLVKNVDSYFLMSAMFNLITAMVSYITLHPELEDDPLFIEQSWEMFYNCVRF